MSDAALRDLERRVAEGDASARARLIAERVRVGALTRDRVHLAAYAGDPDATVVLGKDAPLPCHNARWCLYPYGQQAGVVAAVAVARLLVPFYTRLGATLALRAIEVAETWLRCPCEPCRSVAMRVAHEIEPISRTTGEATYLRPAFRAARSASRKQGARMGAEEDASDAVRLVFAYRESTKPEVLDAAFVSGVDRLTEQDVRRVVNAALRAWALK